MPQGSISSGCTILGGSRKQSRAFRPSDHRDTEIQQLRSQVAQLQNGLDAMQRTLSGIANTKPVRSSGAVKPQRVSISTGGGVFGLKAASPSRKPDRRTQYSAWAAEQRLALAQIDVNEQERSTQTAKVYIEAERRHKFRRLVRKLYAFHAHINGQHFQGQLTTPPIVFRRQTGMWGSYAPATGVICINESKIRFNETGEPDGDLWREMLGVMLHETLHQAVDEFGLADRADGHGESFCRLCNQIGHKLGFRRVYVDVEPRCETWPVETPNARQIYFPSK